LTASLFETARLRAEPAAESDLDALLGVYLSHPEVLELTEGSAGAAGHFDRGMLERDLAMADLDPEETAAALLAGDRPVGILIWRERHPQRGIPWIGLCMIDAAVQRQGYGREAMAGLLAHKVNEGWTEAGIAAVDDRCAGFLQACGFGETGTTRHRFAGGEREVRLFVRQLEAVGSAGDDRGSGLAEEHEA
jgi:RimJ/RimL family protein N-acetyltransferase